MLKVLTIFNTEPGNCEIVFFEFEPNHLLIILFADKMKF